MQLTATVYLRHHFWGTYHASVGIDFADADYAALAAPLFQDPALADAGFTRNPQCPSAWSTCVKDEVFERVKTWLARWGDVSQLDSLGKSIDHGEPCAVTFTVEDPHQSLMCL
jgi:LPS sulfotransferase NodH